jgi:hypothetical protein
MTVSIRKWGNSPAFRDLSIKKQCCTIPKKEKICLSIIQIRK